MDRRHRDKSDSRAVAASVTTFNTAYDNPVYDGDQGQGQGHSRSAPAIATNMPRDMMALQIESGHNLGHGGVSAM